MINVVIVDDSKFMAKALKSILDELGFPVLGVAHDGIEGFEAYKRLQPEVVLLDVTMPNMDGLQCLQHIREINPDARVVMLSAIQDSETIARCMEAGARHFLQKPIRPTSPADLNRLIESIESAASATASPSKATSI